MEKNLIGSYRKDKHLCEASRTGVRDSEGEGEGDIIQ
jgi:hypothetical protein